MAYWLTSWLTEWHTDWLTFMYWLTDWLAHRMKHWMTNWCPDWCILTNYYKCTDWLAEWLAESWLAESWQTNWLTDWQTDWLMYWLTDFQLKGSQGKGYDESKGMSCSPTKVANRSTEEPERWPASNPFKLHLPHIFIISLKIFVFLFIILLCQARKSRRNRSKLVINFLVKLAATRNINNMYSMLIMTLTMPQPSLWKLGNSRNVYIPGRQVIRYFIKWE